jgi:hypothetical protein
MKTVYSQPDITVIQAYDDICPLCGSVTGDLSELHEKGDLDGMDWIYN